MSERITAKQAREMMMDTSLNTDKQVDKIMEWIKGAISRFEDHIEVEYYDCPNNVESYLQLLGYTIERYTSDGDAMRRIKW